MKKQYKTKERISITVDKELYDSFRELTDKKLMKRSTVINFLVEKWVKENKKL